MPSMTTCVAVNTDDDDRRDVRLFWVTMAIVFGTLFLVMLIGGLVYLVGGMWWQ